MEIFYEKRSQINEKQRQAEIDLSHTQKQKHHNKVFLEKTLQGTVGIFSAAFKQGRKEGSLSFTGTDEETAYAFFSFLVGAQVSARVKGGSKGFKTATEIIIKSWEI